jgi:hypothetical protein
MATDAPDADPAAAGAPVPPPEAAPEPEDLTEAEREEQARSERAVVEALDRQKAAEQRQGELAKMSPAERQLAATYPWMTQAERWFVIQNGELLYAPQNVQIAEAAWNEAVSLGVERGSQSFFNFVLSKVARGREAGEAAERLDKDVDRERLISAANAPAPTPESPEALPERAHGGAIPAPRKGMPLAAPVSRSEPMSYSGKPMREDNRLSAEERQIARDSIPDRPDAPRMTDAQKEYVYLQNKRKYEEMKRNGTYDVQTGRR